MHDIPIFIGIGDMRYFAHNLKMKRFLLFLSILFIPLIFSGCVISRYAVAEHTDASFGNLEVRGIDRGEIEVVIRDKTRELKDLKFLQVTVTEDDGTNIPLDLIPKSMSHNGGTPIRPDDKDVRSVGCRYRLKHPTVPNRGLKRPDSPFIVKVIAELDGQEYTFTGTFKIDSKWISFWEIMNDLNG